MIDDEYIPTPLVDAVLADPMTIPVGLSELLWNVESCIRVEHARMTELAGRADVVPEVRASAAELDRFLHDRLRSPLLRALRRPLRQIAPGTRGAHTLRRGQRSATERAARARELQDATDHVNAELARVRDRFAAELPRATRSALAPLTEAAANLRRGRDGEPLVRRIELVEAEMERLWARIPVGAAEVEPGQSWDGDASPGEIVAQLDLRLRQRDDVLRAREQGAVLRRLAVRHARAMGGVATEARPAHTHAQEFAEQLADAVLRGVLEPRDGEELALMCEMVASAGDAAHDPLSPAAWVPQLPDADPEPDHATGATRFVIPIDESYALISPRRQSGVRVKNRGVKIDALVDCTAFAVPGESATRALAALDVRPLFDGVSDEPAWYATETVAQLRVVARIGDEWIGRITRRGKLRRSGTGAWVAEPADRARLRVLGTRAGSTAPLPVGAGAADDRVWCGVRTVSVTTPLVDAVAGWLRPPGDSAWSAAAVRAEGELFREVARRVPFTVPHPAGTAVCAERGLEGLLYIPLLGLRVEESLPLRNWFAEERSVFLRAVGDLWLRMRASGWALGVYHLDALTFRADWSGGGRRPRLHAAVAQAPFAAQFGRFHERPPADAAHAPAYARLGCRMHPPAVAEGGVTLPETEAQAFALFALDVFMDRPLPLHGSANAQQLAEAVRAHPDHSNYPGHTTHFADALSDPAASPRVIEWIERLAGDGKET